MPWRALWPTAAFFTSLIFLRIELAREVDDAQGLGRGVFFDLVVAVYPALLAQLLWVGSVPKRVTWPVIAFLVWLAGFSNVIHYKFFGMRLDWWIVRLHWTDFFVVQGSAAQLGITLPLVVSLLLLVAALVLAAAPRLSGRVPVAAEPPGPWWKARLVRLGWGVALFALCFVLWRVPRWTGWFRGSGVLADNIVRVWVKQTTSRYTFAGAGTRWYETWSEGLDKNDPGRPGRVLAAYRSFEDPGVEHEGAIEIPAEQSSWPLVRQLDVPSEQTTTWRADLGLPTEGPINVVVLFLESVRAYEIYHPDLGPLIFPELRAILAEHSIQFTQAYTSSFTAGQTVRGQFTTLCSMLPNMLGAATYIAHAGLRVRCMAELFEEQGYQTVWMNTHLSSYHNKRGFESSHGTELFIEREDFEARGVTETAGRWGLADQPFLVEVVELLGELAAQGKPVFANVLTISVHHPYSYIDAGRIPEQLVEATKDREYYRKYLSRLRYEDRAVASFFEAFFASPLAENTLVVLLADHSSPVRPHHALANRQFEEMRFRIPIALVTAAPREPRPIATPIHQVDVAPTVAAVAGLEGRVTWVGRNALSGAGTPWVFGDGRQLMFRTSRRGCYPESKKGPMRCYDVAGADPMYAAELPEIPVDDDLTRFFDEVVRANMHAIILNQVEPPDASRD